MTDYRMFSTYLTEKLNAKGTTVPELSKKLGYKTLIHVPHWFKGTGLPPASVLRQLTELPVASTV